MYSSTFIFEKKQFDDDFYRLDDAISQLARTIPGYLGEETWESSSTALLSNVYYWDTLEALHTLVNHPKHREAKAQYQNWLSVYQVIISEVLKTYGDSKLAQLPTAKLFLPAPKP